MTWIFCLKFRKNRYSNSVSQKVSLPVSSLWKYETFAKVSSRERERERRETRFSGFSALSSPLPHSLSLSLPESHWPQFLAYQLSSPIACISWKLAAAVVTRSRRKSQQNPWKVSGRGLENYPNWKFPGITPNNSDEKLKKMKSPPKKPLQATDSDILQPLPSNVSLQRFPLETQKNIFRMPWQCPNRRKAQIDLHSHRRSIWWEMGVEPWCDAWRCVARLGYIYGASRVTSLVASRLGCLSHALSGRLFSMERKKCNEKGRSRVGPQTQWREIAENLRNSNFQNTTDLKDCSEARAIPKCDKLTDFQTSTNSEQSPADAISVG